MAASASRVLLYARTLSRLRARQIAHLVRHRLRPTSADQPLPAVAARRRGDIAPRAPFPGSARHALDGGEFRFLNVSKRFDGDRIDWASAEMSRLWRYNLHYFDYILDASAPRERVAALLTDWIANNAPGRGEGWEPYPASLRVANWVKLFLRGDCSAAVAPSWLDSLYRQTLWLEKNLEYHLLANHLLKNAKALFFAGAFLSGRDADRWLRKGSQMLVEQANEQILEDGGHFERSPMYHALVVEDYLDVLNLAAGSPGLVESIEHELLARRTEAALDFLCDIRRPDGGIPLFNDSAMGIAQPIDALMAYASAVMGYRIPAATQGLHVSKQVPTGYFVMRNGEDMLIVDCGDLGPGYQPGHGHCDTLSFELAIDGRPVIVDSGVYDYEDSETRRYVRGTRAHNTVMVDGAEQSEVWGVFRVARRARPIAADAQKLGESRARFCGSHDGFARLPGRPVHAREIEYETRGIWTVTDTVTGRGEHRVESFVHLHPDLNVRFADTAAVITGRDGNAVANVEALDGARVDLERGWHCPEFGIRRQNVVIRFSSRGPLPIRIGYRIVKCIPKDRAHATGAVSAGIG